MYLNTHSRFSLRYGVLSVDDMLSWAQAAGVTRVALTDVGTTSANWDFVRRAERFGYGLCDLVHRGVLRGKSLREEGEKRGKRGETAPRFRMAGNHGRPQAGRARHAPSTRQNLESAFQPANNNVARLQINVGVLADLHPLGHPEQRPSDPRARRLSSLPAAARVRRRRGA